jgi:hypothetical protein
MPSNNVLINLHILRTKKKKKWKKKEKKEKKKKKKKKKEIERENFFQKVTIINK